VSRPPVVVDTNVVVAGLLTRDAGSPTARILDAMLSGRLRFLLSIDLLAEYRRVLQRPRIAARHGLGAAEIDDILVALTQNGVVDETAAAPRDEGSALPPGDAHLGHLLALAPAARLVTGDAALVHAFGTRALSPHDLLTELSP
jgi:uncharacterized protein